MAIATITTTTLIPTLSKSTLGPAIQTAMNNAGFSNPIDTISSTTDSQIYSYAFNGSTKGTVYLRINISDTTIQQTMGDGWNTATDTGTNFLGQNAYSYTNTNTLTLYAINHDELRMVILYFAASSAAIALGYIRPANKPSWWNENANLYCFNAWGSTSTPIGRGNVCGSNPFSIASAASANDFRCDDVRMIDANPSGNRDVVRSPVFSGIQSPARHPVGRFSSDVAIACANNMAFPDKVQVSAGVEEYFILNISGQTATTSSIAVRVV